MVNNERLNLPLRLIIECNLICLFLLLENNSWKCPACRDISFLVPEDYFCFCGKMKMPEWNRRDVAHSCGEVCGRHLSKKNCPHKCTLLCHPGSCPQCVAMVTKYCGCGRTFKMLLCSVHELLICDSICGKDLSCGKHTCQRKCHQEECGPCDKVVQQSNISIFSSIFNIFN